LAQPYIQQLQQSYNVPGYYLNGADYKAASGIYSDNNLRAKAAAGTTGNMTDHDIAMQQYGLSSLNNYRQGLQNTISGFQGNAAKYAPYNAQGIQTANSAGAPLFAGAGSNNGAGTLGGSLLSSGINSALKQFGIGGPNADLSGAAGAISKLYSNQGQTLDQATQGGGGSVPSVMNGGPGPTSAVDPSLNGGGDPNISLGTYGSFTGQYDNPVATSYPVSAPSSYIDTGNQWDYGDS
jgi:hypothetical protein